MTRYSADSSSFSSLLWIILYLSLLIRNINNGWDLFYFSTILRHSWCSRYKVWICTDSLEISPSYLRNLSGFSVRGWLSRRSGDKQWFKKNILPLPSQKCLLQCSGWCGSVDWVLACEPKGHQFNSQSGHMPGLQARSSVGGEWEVTTPWCFSPSLSPSLPLSLKINKIFIKNKKCFLHSYEFIVILQ